MLTEIEARDVGKDLAAAAGLLAFAAAQLARWDSANPDILLIGEVRSACDTVEEACDRLKDEIQD